jgi:hypothetical protein
MTIKPLLIASALVLTGCGAHGLPNTAAMRQSAPVSARAEAAVTAAELAGRWDEPANEGRRVSLKAAFVPQALSLGYGETSHGYALQGPEGGAIRCANIYRLTRLGGEESHDFAAGARVGLVGGGPVAVRGVFHCSHTASSHGGVYTVPASVEVLTIDAKPVQTYL